MHKPKKSHLQAVQRFLQYLKANLGKGELFKKEEELIEPYSNVLNTSVSNCTCNNSDCISSS